VACAALAAPSGAGAVTWGPITVDVSLEPAYIEQIVDTSTHPAQVYTTGWLRDYTVTAGDVSMCKRGDPPTGYAIVGLEHREYHHPAGPGSGDGYLFDAPGMRQGIIAGDSSFMDDQDIVTEAKLLGNETLIWTFNCLETEATITQTFPVYLVPEGYVPPSPPPSQPPDPMPTRSPEQLAEIHRLEELIAKVEDWRLALEEQRRDMEDAIQELEVTTEVFCGTAASLSVLQGLHAFIWNGFHVAGHKALEEFGSHSICGAIPGFVEAYVDADRKLEENAKMTHEAEQYLERLREQLRGYTISTVIRAAAPRAVGAAKYRSPLAILNSRRRDALGSMAALTAALAQAEATSDPATVRRLAKAAASRLSALPATCSAAKRYLKKAGLGKRFTRKQILKAQRRLKPGRLTPEARAFARALHIPPARLRQAIRSAKDTRPSRLRATAFTDLICSPHLDAIDRSLSASLNKLATAL
jgi:hypothetical protein